MRIASDPNVKLSHSFMVKLCYNNQRNSVEEVGVLLKVDLNVEWEAICMYYKRVKLKNNLSQEW